MNSRSGLLSAIMLFLSACMLQVRAADPVNLQHLKQELALVDLNALERVICDVGIDDPDGFGRQKAEYMHQIGNYTNTFTSIVAGVNAGNEDSLKKAGELLSLRKKILLGNPLLKTFDKVLILRRGLKIGRAHV
jgi:hypothetical protein